jgi:protein-tyrosine phosphatase
MMGTMIDLHCHLAYGVDDGPQSPEESIALAKALYEAGITHVACTSHLRRDKSWVNDQSVQDRNHSNLDQALSTLGPKRLHGAEHYLDELLLETCQKQEAVPYSNTNWILLELPYQIEPPHLMGILFRIRALGYKLLLAHIERFPYVADYPHKLEAFINAGYALQVNLGSLSGAYGKIYQKAAEKIILNDQAYVVAGDCHRAEDVNPYIIQGLKALEKLVGKSGVQRLTLDQPAQILGL